MVMCRMDSVHPPSSPVPVCSMVSTWVVIFVISQNTVRSRSTRSGSSTATSTPLSAAAVRAANTANTSGQPGGWPCTSTLSYAPPACSSSSRSASSRLSWATAADGETASGAVPPSAKKMPKGETIRIPTKHTTPTSARTTPPPAARAESSA